jgi:hypothetical protein
MTTTRSSPLYLIFLIPLLLIAVLLGAPALQFADVPPVDNVVPRLHANQSHTEAEMIRSCLDKTPNPEIWASFNDGTLYKLCKLDDERWGLQALTLKGSLKRVWVEKTAFIRGDGSRQALEEYLKTFSTPWTGITP